MFNSSKAYFVAVAHVAVELLDEEEKDLERGEPDLVVGVVYERVHEDDEVRVVGVHELHVVELAYARLELLDGRQALYLVLARQLAQRRLADQVELESTRRRHLAAATTNSAISIRLRFLDYLRD